MSNGIRDREREIVVEKHRVGAVVLLVTPLSRGVVRGSLIVGFSREESSEWALIYV